MIIPFRRPPWRATVPQHQLSSTRQLVDPHGVAEEDLVPGRRRDAIELLLDHALRIGPVAFGVGEVVCPHDVVLTDAIEVIERGAVDLETHSDLPAEIVAGEVLDLDAAVVPMPHVAVVHLLKPVDKPSRARFGEHELQIRELVENSVADQLRAGSGGRRAAYGHAANNA